MRFGSHVSRRQSGGYGSGGRGPRGPARGPCSAPGPPRAASSWAGALGPAEAGAARQGPGRRLGERLLARRGEMKETAERAGQPCEGGRVARARSRVWKRERRTPLPCRGYSGSPSAEGRSTAWRRRRPLLPLPAPAEIPPLGGLGTPNLPSFFPKPASQAPHT